MYVNYCADISMWIILGLSWKLVVFQQSCEEGRTCPPCLTEKTFDGVVKTITSKFPKLDRARSSIQNMNLSNSTKNDMRQHLQVSVSLYKHLLLLLMFYSRSWVYLKVSLSAVKLILLRFMTEYLVGKFKCLPLKEHFFIITFGYA